MNTNRADYNCDNCKDMISLSNWKVVNVTQKLRVT